MKKALKKSLSAVLALCMVVSMLTCAFTVASADEITVWDGSAAAAFAGGSGTSDSPYIINNGAQLALMANNVNNGVEGAASAYYKLGYDIVLNIDVLNDDYSLNGTPANKWTSIGTSSNPFMGYFDGDDHTISGIYQVGEVCGLFNTFDVSSKEAEIKNLKIVDSYVSGWDNTAVLVSTLKASTGDGKINVNNVYIDANVNTIYNPRYTALFVSNMTGSKAVDATFSNCSANGVVTENATNKSYSAGFVAYNEGCKWNNLTFSCCVNNADVTGKTVAGFLSYANNSSAYDNSRYVYFSDCINTGDITSVSDGGCASGLFAYEEQCRVTTIERCANEGTVIATWRAGGIMGLANTTTRVSMNYVFNIGSISTTTDSPFGAILGKENQDASKWFNSSNWYYLADSCAYSSAFNSGSLSFEPTVVSDLTVYRSGDWLNNTDNWVIAENTNPTIKNVATAPEQIVTEQETEDVYYTVNITVGEGGTVTQNGTPVTTGEYQLKGNASYTLVATANDGYNFVGWYSGDTLLSDKATYVASLISDIDLQVKFEKKIEYNLNLTVTEGGNVTANGGDVLSKYETGTTVTLEAIPSSGYKFAGFYNADNALITSSYFITHTFDSDYTVTVKFEPDTDSSDDIGNIEVTSNGYGKDSNCLALAVDSEYSATGEVSSSLWTATGKNPKWNNSNAEFFASNSYNLTSVAAFNYDNYKFTFELYDTNVIDPSKDKPESGSYKLSYGDVMVEIYHGDASKNAYVKLWHGETLLGIVDGPVAPSDTFTNKFLKAVLYTVTYRNGVLTVENSKVGTIAWITPDGKMASEFTLSNASFSDAHVGFVIPNRSGVYSWFAKLHNVAVYEILPYKNVSEFQTAINEAKTDAERESLVAAYKAVQAKGSEELINSIDVSKLNELRVSAASVTLQSNLQANFKVNINLFENAGYSAPYMTFTLNGQTTTVDKPVEDDGNYVFRFSDIAPDKMNDTITWNLYATKDDEPAYATGEYSIATYCKNLLDKSTDSDSELRTLLVDMLNYGAASQTYTGYNIDNLVNAVLTAEQKGWGTPDTPALEDKLNTAAKTVDDATATWIGAALRLTDRVEMKFILNTNSIDGLTVKFTDSTGDVVYATVASDTFERRAAGGYYVYFDGFDASQMREVVYVTAYNGDTAVSNTIAYSVETYAYAKQNSTVSNLGDLVKAMMKYGDAAEAYKNR